jgi:hypothetical protein
MIDKSFLRASHMPTLAASFFYVDMSFVVWVMLGSLGIGGLVSAWYVEINSFGEIIALGVYSASPERRLAWPCRWLRGGILPNIRGSRLASQARETQARCWPRSLFLALQRRLAGRTCSDWRPLEKLNG